MLKFNCLLVDALYEPSVVWSSDAQRNVIAISSQQSLLLQFETVERTEVVLRSIQVCLEYSRVMSLRAISDQQHNELIVRTVDDFSPDGGWWLDEHKGMLVCPPLAARSPITFQVVVRFQEYILFDC